MVHASPGPAIRHNDLEGAEAVRGHVESTAGAKPQQPVSHQKADFDHSKLADKSLEVPPQEKSAHVPDPPAQKLACCFM
jgi:hypothetical protein